MSDPKAPTDAPSYSVEFGGEMSLSAPPKLTREQERTLYRKLDLRLMPMMTLMYLLCSMDRGNIGNAAIEGLITQLNLVGNQFNIALTMFFIPYCICECPANILIKKFRPSRWLPGITVVWGIVMTLMGLVKTYPQLVGTRVCLGIAEAGLFPGVVYYLTLWYPRNALQLRIGLFFSGASLAYGFSGLLAYGIGFMDGVHGLQGWSWIFILEGLATVVVGILAAFVLVDYPATATFLSPEERAYILWTQKYDNSTVGEQEEFAMRYVLAAFLDWQIWFHVVVYMSIIGPLAGMVLFLPSIIRGFGYSTPVTQLLTIPAYVFGTIITLLFAHYSDKLRIRSPFVLAGLLQLLIGFAIQISDAPMLVRYFGTYLCISGGFSATPGIVAWLGNNLSGQCKRGVGMATQIGIGNFSTLIASNIYRTQDAPRYIFGNSVELVFICVGFFTTSLLAIIYRRINARRDARARDNEKEGHGYSAQELRDLGDRAPDFRYTL